MSAMSINAQNLAEYLLSDECLPWLRQEARSITSRAELLNLPPRIWPFPHRRECSPPELEEYIEEVAHEFWIYLHYFLNKGLVPPPELNDSSGKPSTLTGKYLSNSFLLHLRDLARRKDISQNRYLYRRLREAISQGDQFYLRSIGGGSFYSMEPEARPLVALESMFDQPYSQWPSPIQLISQQDLAQLRRKDMSALAEYFWRHTTQLLGEPRYLPVRSLVDFIAAHYEQFRDPQGEELSGQTLAHEGLQAPPAYDYDGMEVLAWQVASLWPPQRRKVFQLTLEPGELTLAQIAQMADLSGPSHAKYHLDRACDDLALVFESWPGVIPSSHDKSFWSIFLHHIAEICKTGFGDL